MQDLNLDDVMQCKRYADYGIKHGLSLEQIDLLRKLCTDTEQFDRVLSSMKYRSTSHSTHTRI
jgi:hypothetical protein